MAKIAPYLALFIGLALAVLAVPSAVEELQMRNDVETFVSTRADVVEFREQKHQQGPKTQVIRFKYTVEGIPYTGDNRFTRMSNTHDEIAALIRKEKDNKQTLLVYYDEQNPKRVVISKEIGFLVPSGIILATVTLLLTSVYSFVEDRRRRRILERPARSDQPSA